MWKKNSQRDETAYEQTASSRCGRLLSQLYLANPPPAVWLSLCTSPIEAVGGRDLYNEAISGSHAFLYKGVCVRPVSSLHLTQVGNINTWEPIMQITILCNCKQKKYWSSNFWILKWYNSAETCWPSDKHHICIACACKQPSKKPANAASNIDLNCHSYILLTTGHKPEQLIRQIW